MTSGEMNDLCEDEQRLAGCLARSILGTLAAALIVSLAALVVAGWSGCASSHPRTESVGLISCPSVVENHDYGTWRIAFTFDTKASAAQKQKATSYVERYVFHWDGFARHSFAVTMVPSGSLFVAGVPRGGCRVLGTGRVWLTYDPDGTVHAAEWEIPLEAQDAIDPPAWTWGLWGPLYAGQDATFVDATENP